MPARWEQEPQNQLKQLAASVLDHLRRPTLHISGGGSGRAKVAAGNASPAKNSKSSRSIKSIRSIKSNRSIKSSRTDGRAEDGDDELWEYATPEPDHLKAPEKPHGEVGLKGDANSQDKHSSSNNNGSERYEVKRQSTLKDHSSLENLDERGENHNKTVGSRDLYDDYDMGAGSDENNMDDDDDDDDGHQFAKALTAEAQDELAYFSQRVGNADFKLARRLVIHPHGRARAFWDSILVFLISCM